MTWAPERRSSPFEGYRFQHPKQLVVVNVRRNRSYNTKERLRQAMNLPQRIILVVACAALLIKGVFPPWVLVREARGRRVDRAAGYLPLFAETHPQARDRLAAIFGSDAHE